ncbi:hypothetical protein BT67DRAFT_434451 [Trichocladium antarcticum]|uniref:Uncharacterized protein n=1 Tax=Trichocladium antarcticum TaxID=1450529 RepID=A0AAN6ZED3_9PEZI|nr:hypothetical protein BT67DRAFT_434451 [Trichocladium antarcticum]
MAAQYDSGLEAASQNFPEVAAPEHHPYPQQYQQPYQQPYPLPYPHQQPPYDPSATTPKPETTRETPFPEPPSIYGGQTVASPFSGHDRAVAEPPSQPKSAPLRTICGISLLVFILSCIIALLSGAVVGLAAVTGIEAQRANNAASSLAALRSSPTPTATAGPTPSPTAIDDGCADNPDSVDKTVYTSFSLLGALKFTRHCNADAPNPPLLSLFTADFGTCMDACAAWTTYLPRSFDNTANATCHAVSFVPAWTSKATAGAGKAPGNCYLKGGPQNETGLDTPNIGTPCHAAVLLVGG